MTNQVTTSKDSGFLDLQKLVVPALLASSLFTFAGCNERQEIPKQSDPISSLVGAPIQEKYISRDPSLQGLLNSCLDIKRITGDLLQERAINTEDIRTLHAATIQLLEVKKSGSEFTHQQLADDCYRALQETIDAVERGSPIRHTGRGSFYIQDYNYHQVKTLHSNAELIIAALAVPAHK